MVEMGARGVAGRRGGPPAGRPKPPKSATKLKPMSLSGNQQPPKWRHCLSAVRKQLIDEYYQATGMDPRRLQILGEEILVLSRSIGLDKDIGIENSDGENVALSKIDNYLCELMEMQIRDGLHILTTMFKLFFK